MFIPPLTNAHLPSFNSQSIIEPRMIRLHFETICADFEDVLPSDLFDKVSELLQVSYLQKSAVNHQKLIRGTVWSASMRPIISLPVQLSGAITTLSTRNSLNVHFLCLEASPQTYLSEEAMRALRLDDMVVVGELVSTERRGSSIWLPLLLNGYTVVVAQSPAESHFAHLNILGNDFTRARGGSSNEVWWRWRDDAFRDFFSLSFQVVHALVFFLSSLHTDLAPLNTFRLYFLYLLHRLLSTSFGPSKVSFKPIIAKK